MVSFCSEHTQAVTRCAGIAPTLSARVHTHHAIVLEERGVALLASVARVVEEERVARRRTLGEPLHTGLDVGAVGHLARVGLVVSQHADVGGIEAGSNCEELIHVLDVVDAWCVWRRVRIPRQQRSYDREEVRRRRRGLRSCVQPLRRPCEWPM